MTWFGFIQILVRTKPTQGSLFICLHSNPAGRLQVKARHFKCSVEEQGIFMVKKARAIGTMSWSETVLYDNRRQTISLNEVEHSPVHPAGPI